MKDKNEQLMFIERINDLSLSVFEEMKGEHWIDSIFGLIEHNINDQLQKVIIDYLGKVNREGLNPTQMGVEVIVENKWSNSVTVKPNKELDKLIRRSGE